MTRMKALQVTLVCALSSAVSCGAVLAQDALFFSAPSKNINCVYDRNDYNNGQPYVRCDIGQFTPSLTVVPPQSAEEIEVMGKCTLPKMRAFVIGKNAQASSTYCPTDAPIGERQTVIPYSNSWQYDGFTCISETSGMTCRNNLGHGFSLSRASQKLF